jgi:pilus assembly protein CpaE
MSKVIFISPESAFEARLTALLGPSEGPRQRWHDECLRVDPAKVVDVYGEPGLEVVCLGPQLPSAVALSVAEAFDRDRPDVAVVLLAHPDPSLWAGALRAGARDVVAPDAEDQSLAGALQRAGEVARRRRSTVVASEANPKAPARVITVASPKGGCGKTTVSTNLSVGLARSHPGHVVLVDLDLQFGDVGAALGLVPEQTLAGIVTAPTGFDITMVKAFMTPHESGLFVLCAPDDPVEAENITPAHVAAVIDLLKSDFDYVIIDTAAGLADHTLTAIERCTDVVLVGSMDVAGVRSVRKELEVLTQLGLTAQRRHFVLNRSDAKVGMEARDIEDFVGLSVDVAMPSSRLVPLSMNEGVAVIDRDARSPVSRALTDLVEHFAGVTSQSSRGVGSFLRRQREAS